MIPAQQGFGSHDAASVHLRLVPQAELVVADAVANLVLQACARVHGGLQSGRKKADSIASRRLGLVHGDVGLLQDLGSALFSIAEYGDADARGTDELAFAEGMR